MLFCLQVRETSVSEVKWKLTVIVDAYICSWMQLVVSQSSVGFLFIGCKMWLVCLLPSRSPSSLFLSISTFLYVLAVVVWGPHITHSALSLCPSGRRVRLWVALCPIDHQCLLSCCVQGKHSHEALMQNDHCVWCRLEWGYTRAKATQTATRDRARLILCIRLLPFIFPLNNDLTLSCTDITGKISCYTWHSFSWPGSPRGAQIWILLMKCSLIFPFYFIRPTS